MESQNTKKSSKIWLISLILVLLCGGVFAAYKSDASAFLASKLEDLNLVPKTEHFTELYFNNESFLPKDTIQHKTETFSFTIHNSEGTMKQYDYQVYFEYPSGHKVMFGQKSVTLADGASASVMVSHTFLGSNETGKVVVTIPSIHQSIDFLVPNKN